MCDFKCLILVFLREFLSVGGQEEYFLVSIKILIFTDRTYKIGQRISVYGQNEYCIVILYSKE